MRDVQVVIYHTYYGIDKSPPPPSPTDEAEQNRMGLHLAPIDPNPHRFQDIRTGVT